ncbi:MAG: histidine-type phosphatase [Bacteroidaceae bacterium]|nr:histidine-type phosphatase [Bacteroidaceae bacterium]
MKRTSLWLMVVAAQLITLPLFAQRTAREEIAANRFLCASNYLDYDNHPATEALTPAPKGYVPFFMNHYGRHGARWLIGDWEYKNAITVLQRSRAAGKLSDKGEETLQQLERFYKTTYKRLGELTTVGERQHHGIGRRMAEHFPEIFKQKNVPIDARSTVVIRCILSMEAECEELAAANPTARFHNDVSESFQYYLNADWPRSLRDANRKGGKYGQEYRQRLTHPERLMGVLFNDPAWTQDSIDARGFMRQLFYVASNMQSHETDIDLLSLFTSEELYDLWRIKNIDWYLSYGHAPQTDGVMPFSQAELLKNMIATADTITRTQAVLRFGHEVCVMPLACLLELGTCGARVENLDDLDAVWRNYNIFPMACNIQLIYYRPKKAKGPVDMTVPDGDILVKALLNEREMTLPVPTTQHPYYRWADLRAYYLKKLADFEAMQ